MNRRHWLLVCLVLLGLTSPAFAQAKKKLLLVGHPPDGHPPETHEYVAGLRVLAKCLEKVEGLEITQVEAVGAWKDGPELMARADGVVLFVSEGGKWLQTDPERYRRWPRWRNAAAASSGCTGQSAPRTPIRSPTS